MAVRRPESRRPAPANPRGLSESGVGERVQRFVQLAHLPREERKPFLLLRGSVEALELAGDAVEALEERVELAISQVFPFHDPDCTRHGGREPEARPPSNSLLPGL